MWANRDRDGPAEQTARQPVSILPIWALRLCGPTLDSQHDFGGRSGEIALAWLSMGTFRVQLEVGHPAGERLERIEALVDTGATYTVLPPALLERLGVQPEEEWPFILADGRQVSYRIGWVQVRIDGRSQPTIAVFGDPEAEPLLGVFTLEGFRLAADPINRRLVPVPARLK
jgi:clan AA aspartic protease